MPLIFAKKTNLPMLVILLRLKGLKFVFDLVLEIFSNFSKNWKKCKNGCFGTFWKILKFFRIFRKVEKSAKWLFWHFLKNFEIFSNFSKSWKKCKNGCFGPFWNFLKNHKKGTFWPPKIPLFWKILILRKWFYKWICGHSEYFFIKKRFWPVSEP